jgi:hypothetical protein
MFWICFMLEREEYCCLDVWKVSTNRVGSALHNVVIIDLNNLMVGTSPDVPLCQIKLKRMCWLSFGGGATFFRFVIDWGITL